MSPHPSTPLRGEFRPPRARSSIARTLLYRVRVRSLLPFLFAFVVHTGWSQPTWRVDSLLSTWPVRLAVEEARHDARPGVIRAVDTRDLYAQLQKAAPTLPVFADSNVVNYVDLYGERKREDFRALLGAAQHYWPLIEGELVRQGLSKDLKYLPMAMSAMNTLAGSPHGEAGVWMLTYPVAVRYGLHVDAEHDERRDPRLATIAAVRYLKDLHVRYTDPQLAVMAFACGPANVARAQARTGNSTDVRTLYPQFSEGQREVLPMLMAFVHLSAQANALGIVPIEVMPFEAADSVSTTSELRFAAIAAVMNVPVPRLRALNPVLCSDRVPAFDRFYLPRGERERFAQLSDSISRMQQQAAPAPLFAAAAPTRTEDGREAIHYRVRSGDYLGRIAMRFGVRVSQIKTWNKLRSDRISAGDRLLIYLPASQRARYERHAGGSGDEPVNRTVAPPTGTNASVRTPIADFTWYTVQAGDSLYAIAKRYPGVEARDLMQVNGITANIKPGQKLKIPVGK